jgi:hypothetical protein
MTAKSVLNRIAQMLSLEVTLTDATTKDGTILQSPTFDLDETVDIVDADGKKTPAPDGEYEIALKDSEGKDVIIRVEVKDGKISERENVEEAHPEVENEMGKMDEEVVDKKAAVEEHMAAADVTTEEAKSLPNTTDEDPRNRVGSDKDDLKDPIISLAYRIDELEAKLGAMTEKFNTAFPEEGMDVSSLTPNPTMMEEVEEEELPKLDGAPVDMIAKLSAIETNRNNFGKKSADYQSSVLSKMYK